jgi:hypothetical protein
MSIRGTFSFIPKDVVEWGRYFQSVIVETDPGTVTDDSFAPRSGLSVIGRSLSTTGQPADINASANGTFLGRRTDVVGFFAINDADIPSSIARDSEVSTAASGAQSGAEATAAAALADHEAASDPHPGYLTAAEGNAAYAPIQTTGTYTAAFTGTTTDPAPTIRWSLVGAHVDLYIPQSSATSNATSFTITGMPAGVRPARAQTMLCRVQDNGTVSIGIVSIGTDGTLTFGLGVTGAVFTNTGTKGVELQTLGYSRD